MNAAKPDFRPKHLRAYIGGHFGPSYAIELTGDSILHDPHHLAYPTRIDG